MLGVERLNRTTRVISHIRWPCPKFPSISVAIHRTNNATSLQQNLTCMPWRPSHDWLWCITSVREHLQDSGPLLGLLSTQSSGWISKVRRMNSYHNSEVSAVLLELQVSAVHRLKSSSRSASIVSWHEISARDTYMFSWNGNSERKDLTIYAEATLLSMVQFIALSQWMVASY